MNTRIHLLVATLAAACGVATTAIIGLAVWRAAPERTAAPAHGEFAARLQPVLEGIGSTRELTPDPLGAGATEPKRAASGGGVPPAEHRHHERRRRPQ